MTRTQKVMAFGKVFESLRFRRIKIYAKQFSVADNQPRVQTSGLRSTSGPDCPVYIGYSRAATEIRSGTSLAFNEYVGCDLLGS